MNFRKPPVDLSQAQIDALLAEPAIATLIAGGAPVLVVAIDPVRVVWANGPAQILFRTSRPDEISRRALTAGAGSSRLGELARTLQPGAPPRLERVRLVIGRNVETLTFLCRRTDNSARLFLAAALGTRPLRNDGGAMPAPMCAFTTDGAPSAEPIKLADVTLPVEDLAPVEDISEPAVATLAHIPSFTPNIRSATEVAADLAERFQDAPVVRFLWKSDARRCLTEITGELCDVVGCDTPGLIGRDFVTFAEAFGAEPQERLHSAFARRETWSGVEILWPIASAAAAVPEIGRASCRERVLELV